MKLRKHQEVVIQQGEEVIKEHGCVYFAVECRVGKTLVALELARRVADGGRVLFVTPKAAIRSVEADSTAMGGWGDSLVVINRESLHRVPVGDFSVVVADEGHRDGGFPKVNQGCARLEEISRKAQACIILSGTPSVESASQLFHQFWWTNKGPWKRYGGKRGFYGWHRDFGVQKMKRVAGGQEVKDYTEVRAEVMDHLEGYVVRMTQEEAGFKFAPEVVPHLVTSGGGLLEWSKQFEKKGIWTDPDGKVVVGETPASVLQKRHMAEGGTLIDEDGESFVHDMFPYYKINYMLDRLEKGKEYAIVTAYIRERQFIVDELRAAGHKVVDDLADFVEGCGGIFVGSGISNAEGIDLAWMTGSMIIYSLNWSGAKFLQLLERQNNWARDRPIKVHVLLCRGGVDEDVFSAVKNKQSFNASFFRGRGRTQKVTS